MEHITKSLAVGQPTAPTPAVPASTRITDEFSDFLTLGDPSLEKMKEEAIRFASDMLENREPRWLTLLGTSGVGKTMLAKKISRLFRRWMYFTVQSETVERITRRRGGFKSWIEVVSDLRGRDYSGFGDLKEDWFVVIDDIGAEHSTDFITGKLYELLNAREKKWTVITANLSLGDIEQKIDARIASRMIRHGSVVVDVDVVDWNLRK